MKKRKERPKCVLGKKPQKPIFRCATNFMLTLNHINCECGLVCEVRDGKQSFFFADDGKSLSLIRWEGNVQSLK